MGKASSKDDQPSSGSSSSSDAGPEASTAPTAGEPLRISVAHTKASVSCLCQAKSTALGRARPCRRGCLFLGEVPQMMTRWRESQKDA